MGEQQQQKEKFQGVWANTGEQVSFSREWSTHRFTDQECIDLLAGKEITFRTLSARTGNEYEAKGVLEAQVFEKDGKKFPFIGFKPDFGPKVDASGKPVPPDSWGGHTFTQEEKDTLADGGKVYADDFVSKKSGRTYETTVRFGDSGGTVKVIPSFADDF